MLPDRIQAQIELHDLTALLSGQGITLESPWRATRIALGARGVARYLVGEILTLAPAAVFIGSAGLHLRVIMFVWVPVIGIAWWTRDGRTSLLGCILSVAVPLGLAGFLATFDPSPIHLLGALCVSWVWWFGAYTRELQRNAIVRNLANNPGLYDQLRAVRAVGGPEHADLHVTIRRSDQIEPG